MGGTPFQDELIQKDVVLTRDLMSQAVLDTDNLYREAGNASDELFFNTGDSGIDGINKVQSGYTYNTKDKKSYNRSYNKYNKKDLYDYNKNMGEDNYMSEDIMDDEMSTSRRKTNAYLKKFLDPNILARMRIADQYMDMQSERSKKHLLEEKKNRLEAEMELERQKQIYERMMPKGKKGSGGSGSSGGITPAILNVMTEKDKQGLAGMNPEGMRNYAILKALDDNPQAALFLATMQQNQAPSKDGVEKASDIVSSMAQMYEAIKPKETSNTNPLEYLIKYMSESSLQGQNQTMQFLTALITLMQGNQQQNRDMQNAYFQTQIDMIREQGGNNKTSKQEMVEWMNVLKMMQEMFGGMGKQSPEDKKWETIGNMIGGATEMLGQTLVAPAAEAMSARMKQPPPMPMMGMPGMGMPGMGVTPPPNLRIFPDSGRIETPAAEIMNPPVAAGHPTDKKRQPKERDDYYTNTFLA
jgi:hypothetical protein